MLSSLLERSEGCVFLQALCESSSAFWSNVVLLETASKGAGRVHVKALTGKQTLGWLAHLSDLTVELIEMYSARALAVSWPMPSSDRSHDSILAPLFLQRASNTEHQPFSPMLFLRKLSKAGRVKGADRKRTLLAWV